MIQVQQSSRGVWFAVTIFAVAFAWVEAAVVLYLRTLVDRLDPYQANPLPLVQDMVWVEIVREAATMIILVTVGFIAGRNLASRVGYTLIAFGLWDIFYYVFLIPMTGWPTSPLDWDILFLIPLPWWGPVLAPILISALMIAWGTLVTQIESLQNFALRNWRILAVNALGALLALYVFMADAIRVAPDGEDALRQMVPTQFRWPLFGLALLLMAAPLVQLLRVLWNSRTASRASSRDRSPQARGLAQPIPTRWEEPS